MKILMLLAYYEPEKVPSNYLITNLLPPIVEIGWEVEIYTPIPSRGVDNQTRQYFVKHKHEALFNGSVVIHRFSLPRERHSTFLRFLRYLFMSLKFIFIGISSNANLIYVFSTPPTQGFVASVIKKLKKIPFIYNVQDIFPDSMVHSKMTKKGSLIWKIGRVIESISYKNAEKIITISENMKLNIHNKGIDENKIFVIHNWVETDKILPVDIVNNPLYNRYKLPNNGFVVVYAGNLGYAQNVGFLLDAALQFKQVPNLHFLIFGSGSCENEIRKSIIERKITNVRLFPPVPYSEVSFVYSLGNVGIVSCKKGFGGIAMPSKTWSILATGTPILANFDECSELHDLIVQNNFGIFSISEDLEAFVGAIHTLFLDPGLCKELGRNGREYVEENLSVNIGTKKIIELFESAKGRIKNV
jgi:glycosyltransferase involved in cell wall biosynthesis